jgi:glycosyltransferase involved in cell wall biosynthesis
MRILQLCPKIPWPPEDGGRIAMRVLARSLKRAGAEVRILALNPAKNRTAPESLPDEAREPALEAIDIDTSVTLGGALRSFLAGTSYNVERFLSKAFESRLLEVLQEERPDVVILESVFMVPYLPSIRPATGALVVLRSHNVEHQIWQGLARIERRGPKRLYLRHLADRLRDYEASTVNDVDAVVPVTPEDAMGYRQLGATVPLHVAPVGIATDEYPDRAGHGDPLTLVFLGSLDWTPNVDAVRWFLGSVWPLLRRSVPGARFHIGGSNPPPGLADALRAEGARFLGRVPDAREFLASGAAMVVPLLAGGGVRVKILEAMALGVPVVSTRLGATSIDARAGEEILLADGPDSLAEACATLLTDRERAISLGRSGRRRARESFDADGVGRRLLSFLADALRQRSPGKGDD